MLCIAERKRFLPIVKYTGAAGKKEIAETVFGLRLRDLEATSFTIGRLIPRQRAAYARRGDVGDARDRARRAAKLSTRVT